MNWYDDLCEYYDVTPEEAIEMSTRKDGRKPSLPGSKTCEPVSEMTWEEIWDSKPRDTIEQKFEFYKDIGSWQSFRQCNYRKDFNYGSLYKRFCTNESHVLEYGCGIAPMADFLANQIGDKHKLKFTLTEVPSEHYEFAKWRLGDEKFDFVCLMDVLEHLPNPYDVVENIYNHMNMGGYMLETWVNHPDGARASDLQEAEDQRPKTMNFLNANLQVISELSPTMRMRQKIVAPRNHKDKKYFINF